MVHDQRKIVHNYYNYLNTKFNKNILRCNGFVYSSKLLRFTICAIGLCIGG